MAPPEGQDRRIVNVSWREFTSPYACPEENGHCDLLLHDVGFHALYLACYLVPADSADLTKTFGALPIHSGSVHWIP